MSSAEGAAQLAGFDPGAYRAEVQEALLDRMLEALGLSHAFE